MQNWVAFFSFLLFVKPAFCSCFLVHQSADGENTPPARRTFVDVNLTSKTGVDLVMYVARSSALSSLHTEREGGGGGGG